MEVASLRSDHMPTRSAAKTSEHSLLIKSPSWWRSGRCRQCYSDFLLQCDGDIEADHAESGIIIDYANRNRETFMRQANNNNDIIQWKTVVAILAIANSNQMVYGVYILTC